MSAGIFGDGFLQRSMRVTLFVTCVFLELLGS